MSRKTTMTDIARALGVSQTLVSFVLSGKNDMGISADTKKKVLQTAEKMGYCSGTVSKILKLGRCGYAALVFADAPGGELSDIVAGIYDGLSEFGYNLVMTNPAKITDIDECLQMALQKRVDGFIVFGENAALENRLSEKGVVFMSFSDAASARKCARMLCEAVLNAGDKKGKSDAKKKSAKSAGIKKASSSAAKSGKKRTSEVTIDANKQVADKTIGSTEKSVKKEDSIWLL